MKRSIIYLLVFIFIAMTTIVNGQINIRKNRSQPQDRTRIKQRIDRLAGRLSPEQEQQALEFLNQLDPPSVKQLQELESSNPEAYKRRILLIFREMKKLQAFEDEEPELYDRKRKMTQLEVKEKRLASEYKNTAEDEKPQILGELRSVLDELFDLRELDRRDQIAKMEQRLEKLRQTLQERAENKQQIIDHRINMLTQNRDELRW
ncbi:hypothetical protein GF407_09570 [candidate division KSB1 bacterium]|nr:hypothetical protein [candidate division KSB1 bacterium]